VVKKADSKSVIIFRSSLWFVTRQIKSLNLSDRLISYALRCRTRDCYFVM